MYCNDFDKGMTLEIVEYFSADISQVACSKCFRILNASLVKSISLEDKQGWV